MATLWLVIVGAGGHGSELLSYTEDLEATGAEIDLLGFIDEGTPPGPIGSTQILGDLAVLARLARSHPRETIHYITAVGSNRAREGLVQRIEGLGLPNLAPWALIHPRATVGSDVSIGPGTCLAPGSIATTRVRIGRHCILNVKASVSHDTVVEDFANLNPGATIAGGVRVGRGCFVGAGATVIQEVSLGENSVIGAGAVVLGDIPANVTAVGVPARIVKRHGE
jgi:sugar O-acyltransferase (sialic acid O-acetyltransferase NeuD family)